MSADEARTSPSAPPSAPPSDAPGRRTRDAEVTKKKLLDAAETEFASKGFAGARLRDVAAAAGVQQALIHHYFSDKSGLYRAVLDRAIAETTRDSWSILGSVTGTTELLESFVEMLVRFYASHAHLLAILRMEASGGGSIAIELMRERTKPVFDAVEAVLEKAQASGELRDDVPASEIIVTVLAMTIFPYQEAPLLEALWPGSGPRDIAIEEKKRRIVAIALRGIVRA
jgi:TetR/AcrR family transcriptional regulator